MLLVIFSFLCFVVTVYGAFKVFKYVRANDTENSNRWLIVIITFMATSWIVRFIYSLFQFTVSEESEKAKSKRKYYFLNEDYTFFEGTTPKAYFKKGDLVQGYVTKHNANSKGVDTSLNMPAIINEKDFLELLNAKIAIPLSLLRFPTETELEEIEGDEKKFMDNLK